MVRSSLQYEKPVESYLKPNTFMHWQGHTYGILSRDLRTVTIEDISSPETESQTIGVVDLVVPEGVIPPVFAPTLEKLSEKLQKLQPPSERSADADLPQSLKDKAQLMVKKYKEIERLLAEEKDLIEKAGDTFRRTLALEAICQLGEIDISVATYYNYRDRYREYSGDQAAISA